jgi:hypothetical protein
VTTPDYSSSIPRGRIWNRSWEVRSAVTESRIKMVSGS